MITDKGSGRAVYTFPSGFAASQTVLFRISSIVANVDEVSPRLRVEKHDFWLDKKASRLFNWNPFIEEEKERDILYV